MRQLNPQNLRPCKTKEEARERGHNGGIKSAKVRRERKLLSEIYAEALADKYDILITPAVKVDGKVIEPEKRVNLEGKALFNHVFGELLSRCDASTVQLLKAIGDLTEGQKHILSNDPENPLFSDEAAKAVLAKHGI